MARELFQKLGEGDFNIIDVQNEALDPMLGEAALSDLTASVSNIMNHLHNFDAGDYQSLSNAISSAIIAFRTGVTREHINQALMGAWEKNKK